MGKLAIAKVSLPAGSLVAALLPSFGDHADAFRARVDPASFPDVDAAMQALFARDAPAWVAAAMRTRDAVVGTLFGLKTSRELRDAPGRSSIFEVLDRSSQEIILGEDDRHLDFRVSVLYERSGHDAFVTVSTIVRFNNTLGRAYFVPVRPVHKLVVPAMMRRVLAASPPPPT